MAAFVDTADLVHGGKFHTCSPSCEGACGPSLRNARATGKWEGHRAATMRYERVPARYFVCVPDGRIYRRDDIDYAGRRHDVDHTGRFPVDAPTLVTDPVESAWAEGYIEGYGAPWPSERVHVEHAPVACYAQILDAPGIGAEVEKRLTEAEPGALLRRAALRAGAR